MKKVDVTKRATGSEAVRGPQIGARGGPQDPRFSQPLRVPQVPGGLEMVDESAELLLVALWLQQVVHL